MSGTTDAIAVLDVGKTNVKLVAVDRSGRVLSSRQAPNVIERSGPYPHPALDHIWRWLMAALADFGERFRILAIVPTTYGSSAALLGEAGLAMPVLDYEAHEPEALAAAYAEAAPWFTECYADIAPAGLTLGRQLFWQRHTQPGWAEVRAILPYPQYWGWRLSGVAASEITSLGAQTQLWDFQADGFSRLARSEGFAELFPPFRRAFDVLGPITTEVALTSELPADTPVLTGIHDSNANFARYLAAGLETFTLISSGTWLITLRPGLPLTALEPLRDTVANLDLLGRPVASARVMGGREWALIAGEGAPDPEEADLKAVLEAGTLALPSFTTSGGPFPGTGGKGRITGPLPATPSTRAALATLYVALMTVVDLDLLDATSGPIVIDGRFADQPMFARVLAALRPDQEVLISPEPDGTAIGAALLWGWSQRTAPVPVELEPVQPLALAGLAAYAATWRQAVNAAAP